MCALGEKNPTVSGEIVTGKSLRELTSFRAGGTADYFITLQDMTDLWNVFAHCDAKDIPFVVVGNGSKLLFQDEGFRGAVIKLAGEFCSTQVEGEQLVVGAGTDLGTLLGCAVDNELAGLEFLAGIPGTVGGAVVRNAGAFGKSLSERIVSVTVLDTTTSGTKSTSVLDSGLMEFDYRTSVFLHRRELVLIEVRLQLTPDSADKIVERVAQASKKKKQTQPLSYPSAGCVFKNPAHYSAGYLIQNAGCLGMRIGDAQVSFQHGNFIINKGEATAQDIIELMERVKQTVKVKYGVQLEPEIEIL